MIRSAALLAIVVAYFGRSAPNFVLTIQPVGPSQQYLVTRPVSVDARGSAFFVTVDPQPAPFPNVVWALDGNAAALEADPARAGTVYVDPANGGVTTLHAYVGPPVNRAVDTPLFAYRSLEIDCRAQARSGLAELYVAPGACARAPALETPYGATLVPAATLDAFAAVSVRQFDGNLARLPAGARGAAIVRSRDGSLLKLWLAPQRGRIVDAPYVWSSNGAEFPDASFATSTRTQSVGPVPGGIRIPGASPDVAASPLIT